MRNTRSKVSSEVFSIIRENLRFSLKARGNTGNIFVQLNVAMQVKKCCWPYYHPFQTLPRNKMFSLQVWRKMLKISRCQFNLLRNMLQQLATTNFWCVTIFDICGKYVQQRFSTCNATMFRLQVAVICCSYYFTVTQLGPSLETLDIAFRTSAVHQPCAFRFVFLHCLRRTPNVNCTN